MEQRKQDQNVPRQSSVEPMQDSGENVQNNSSVGGDSRLERNKESNSGGISNRGRNTEMSEQEQIPERGHSQSER
jgi:hypothetical protein